MRRLILIPAIAVFAACGGADGGESAMPDRHLPDSSAQGPGEAAVSVRLEAGEEALLFGSGRVISVEVEAGDTVRAGQVLVSLSGDAVVENAVSARARELEAARVEADNSEAQYLRCAELFEAGAVSAADLEGAGTAMTAADAAFRAAWAEYSSAVSGREASVIQAPFDGVVGRVWAGEGDMAGTDPLLMLTSGSGLQARALLPESELGCIDPGASAEFESISAPGMRFEGRVSTVSPCVDPVTFLLPVTVTIEDPEGRLAPGFYGTLSIARSRRGPQS